MREEAKKGRIWQSKEVKVSIRSIKLIASESDVDIVKSSQEELDVKVRTFRFIDVRWKKRLNVEVVKI